MEVLSKINWVDILAVIIVIRISYVTFQEGFSHGIFPLLGNVCITILSLHYYSKIGSIISGSFVKIPAEAADFISFLRIGVISAFILKFLKLLLDKIIKVEWHPVIEKFGGLVIGVLRGGIVTSLVLITLVLLPIPYLQWSVRDRSFSGIYFLSIGPSIYGKVSGFIPKISQEAGSVKKEDIVKRLVADKYLSANAKEAQGQVPAKK